MEDPVSEIIKRFSEDNILRHRFGLKDSVTFQNHSNTLSPDRTTEGTQPLKINNPQHSESLQAHANKPREGSSKSKSVTNSFRPRADQFCVYSISAGEFGIEYRVAALVIEYKAPHKLILAHIYEGLAEMNLDEIVQQGESENTKIRCNRLVAAVTTQCLAYLVKAGVEYGEIYPGEATIFLRIPEDPSIVYYALSVPKENVGDSTAREAETALAVAVHRLYHRTHRRELWISATVISANHSRRLLQPTRARQMLLLTPHCFPPKPKFKRLRPLRLPTVQSSRSFSRQMECLVMPMLIHKHTNESATQS